MKKALSIILSMILVIGMVLSMPISTSAITIEEMDKAIASETTVFDFEDPDKIKVGSHSLGENSKVEWRVDATHTLRYYYSGWGFDEIVDNPVQGSTDAQGSIVNSSSKVLRAQKTDKYNSWATGGGFVLNTITGTGVKPYILESDTTYTVELDYMIKSTHLYDEVQKPDGSGNITIPRDKADELSFGYGYKENTDTNTGAVSKPVKTVATVASYMPSRDVDGCFTAYDGVKEVGNWYHASFTFTTGHFEDLYSLNNAPFLIIYASKYTGCEILVDNIAVGKTETNSAFYNFEDKEFMKVTSMSQDSQKVTWKVSDDTTVEYFCSGWSLSAIGANPVTGVTGHEGSVVNASANALFATKTAWNSYPTTGGTVINRITENGVEPLILEDKTTYTVEFDYLVYATHPYGTFDHPNDPAKSPITISNTAEDMLSFGYGYQIETRGGYGATREAIKTVDKVASYRADTNADGYYTAHDDTQKPIGSWYHVSYEFTTGTFTSIYPNPTNNAPFLIFYAQTYFGAQMMVDNIKVSKHATVNFNAMGGTVSVSSVKGEIGTAITLPTASRFGYEFMGWYEDSACTKPFTDTTFTKENAGTTIFAGWEQGINTFENYTAPTNSSNGSRFSWVTNSLAFRGKGSIKYSYSTGTLENWTRTNANNYFVISPLESNNTYRVTFKYYLKNGANTTVYPVTVGNSNSSSTGRKEYKDTGAQIVLDSSGAGRWHTASLVFTSDMTSGYNNFGLHIHPNSNTATELYIDDVKIVPVENGNGALTIGGGQYGSVAAGASTRTVYLGVGDKIDSSFVYNKGYAVEGWYKDTNLTEKVPADVYSEALKNGETTVYPKFSERVDLTAHGVKGRTGGFIEEDYEDILYYKGSSGTAPLASVTKGNTYMVEFLYKNKGGTDVTLSINSGSFVAKRNTPNQWCKGYIPVTATTTGALVLSASGNSKLEIKDVYIKDITGKVYVMFDSTEFGGEITAVYGAEGDEINFPANPIVSGMKFDGWYNGSTKFTGTTFPAASVSLTASMVSSGESVAGDCDGDGICNTTDLAKMKHYLAKIDVQIAESADINGDGKINAIDLVLLKKQLAG